MNLFTEENYPILGKEYHWLLSRTNTFCEEDNVIEIVTSG